MRHGVLLIDGVPSPDLGVPGQYARDRTTRALWKKEQGDLLGPAMWVQVAAPQILKGEKGDKGYPGDAIGGMPQPLHPTSAPQFKRLLIGDNSPVGLAGFDGLINGNVSVQVEKLIVSTSNAVVAKGSSADWGQDAGCAIDFSTASQFGRFLCFNYGTSSYLPVCTGLSDFIVGANSAGDSVHKFQVTGDAKITGFIVATSTITGTTLIGTGLTLSAANPDPSVTSTTTTTTTVGDKDSRLLLINNSNTAFAGGEVVIGMTGDTTTGRYASIGADIRANSSGQARGDIYLATKAAVGDTTLTRRFTVFSSGAIIANDNGDDADFTIEGDTATNLFVTDAGTDAVRIGTTTAGVIAHFATGGIVFNEDGTDRDIRFEGNTDANLFVTDAGNDRVGVGTATPGNKLDVNGGLDTQGKFGKYNAISVAGWGMPAIYGTGRSTAQTAAVATVATYTVGASDGSFTVSANVNVTTSTTHTIAVQVDYTDETNTARTLTLPFAQLAGTIITSITNVTGAGPYEGVPLHIRCKSATAITVKTTGVFTTVTYNVEASIIQIA